MNPIRLSWYLCSGIAIAYLERVAVSQSMPAIAGDFNLSAQQQGWLFSAFSWGYVVGMLPGGILIRAIGGRHSFAIAVGASGLVCAALPVVHSYLGLLTARLLLGVVEAPLFPAAATIVRETMIPGSRGKTTAAFDAGSYLGGASVGFFYPSIMASCGWRTSMFLGPLLAIMWLCFYAQFSVCFSRGVPRQSVCVGVSIPESIRRRYAQLLLISIVFAIYNFIKGFFLTWFPTFLRNEGRYSIAWLSISTAIPFVAAVGAECASGCIMDVLIRAGHPVCKVRGAVLLLGLCGSASVYLFPLCHNMWGSSLVMVGSFASLIAVSPALWALPGDLTDNPQQTAIYGAIMNCIANIGGIISPIVISSFTGKGQGPSEACAMLASTALGGAFLSLAVLQRNFKGGDKLDTAV